MKARVRDLPTWGWMVMAQMLVGWKYIVICGVNMFQRTKNEHTHTHKHTHTRTHKYTIFLSFVLFFDLFIFFPSLLLSTYVCIDRYMDINIHLIREYCGRCLMGARSAHPWPAPDFRYHWSSKCSVQRLCNPVGLWQHHLEGWWYSTLLANSKNSQNM